jgi:hypothetical protein
MLTRDPTIGADWLTSLARLELATLEIGLRLWRQWLEVGGIAAADLSRMRLASPPAARAGFDPALQAALIRLVGQLAQAPFQMALQLLAEVRTFLVGARARADTSRADLESAIAHVRNASDILSRTRHAPMPDESARGLGQLARELDEIRLRLQRALEAPRRAWDADPDA